MNRPTSGRRPAAPTALGLALVALVAVTLLPACGKKGPPLPPLVKVPVRPDPFTARRLGAVVYLQVRVPTANSDSTTPADIRRVEVYGYTGSPSGNEDIFKYGTLVASIPVRKPPEEQLEKKSGKSGRKPQKPESRPPAPPRPPGSMEIGFDQGDTIVVTEPLGPAQYVEVVPKVKKAPKPVPPPPQVAPRPLGPPPLVPLPARLYVAVGVNRKGQKGAVSARQAVTLAAPPSVPSEPAVTYSETAFSVAWTPPADAQPPAASGPDVLKSAPIGTRQISGAFNVYEVPLPPAAAPPGGVRIPTPPTTAGKVPVPVNPTPVAASPFVDARMTFDKPRCYAVRAVTVYGAQPVESDLSASACVTPVDTFPPAAPASLKAVGSEGAISLIWEANKEADLAGYIVMRAAAPDGEFKPLTPAPIAETTFNDTTVAPGTRYAYVVIAVDASKNRSAPSNRVEESARVPE